MKRIVIAFSVGIAIVALFVGLSFLQEDVDPCADCQKPLNMQSSIYECDCGDGVEVEVLAVYPSWVEWEWSDAARWVESPERQGCVCIYAGPLQAVE